MENSLITSDDKVTWTISNDFLDDEIRESEEFSVDENKNFTWKLSISRQGHKNPLYLSLVKCKYETIQVVSFVNIENQKQQQGSDFYVGEKKLLCSLPFSNASLLMCEVKLRTAAQKIISKDKEYDTEYASKITNKIIMLKKILQNKNLLLKHYEALLDDSKFSDVKIEVAGTTIHAHKSILTTRSGFFAAMFDNDMKESRDGVVIIEDTSANIIKEMLRFIYTGRAENLKENAKELLVAADKYALDDLKLICENSLCKDMTADNAIEMLKFSDLHNANDLKNFIIDFFTNKKSLVATKDFASLVHSNPDIVVEVLKSFSKPSTPDNDATNVKVQNENKKTKNQRTGKCNIHFRV